MDLLLCYDSDESSIDGNPRGERGPPAPSNDGENANVLEAEREGTTTTTAGQRQVGRGSVQIVNSCTFNRSEPHVRGNWTGHVFARILAPEFRDVATSEVVRFKDRLERAGYSCDLYQHESYHLSLSRPFYLQEASIESFVSMLRDRLQYQEAFTSKVLVRGTTFVNEEGTRSFWTLPVVTSDDLIATVRAVDEVLVQFKQPTYYDPPSFHVSVASVPLLVAEDRMATDCKCPGSLQLLIQSILCTFGTTKEYEIRLS